MSGSVGQRQKSGTRAVGRSAMAIAVLLASLLAASVVTVADGAPASAEPATSAYVAIAPYRLADTRRPECGCTRLDPATIEVAVSGRPGVPPAAVAVSVTITATETATPGFVTLYPGGAPRPFVSVLNTRPDRPVANSAIIALGADGTIELFENVPGDLIVDITGAFVAASSATAGRFVPVATRRLLDTQSLESLLPGLARQLPEIARVSYMTPYGALRTFPVLSTMSTARSMCRRLLDRTAFNKATSTSAVFARYVKARKSFGKHDPPNANPGFR